MNNPELTWVKSSYSSEGNCVEVADHDHHVMVRDTKDRPGTVLRFSLRQSRPAQPPGPGDPATRDCPERRIFRARCPFQRYQ